MTAIGRTGESLAEKEHAMVANIKVSPTNRTPGTLLRIYPAPINDSILLRGSTTCIEALNNHYSYI